MPDEGTITEGMPVFSADGHRLGAVVRLAFNGAFEVEHGFLFPHDTVVEPRGVDRVTADGVFLKGERKALLETWRAIELFSRGDTARADLPRPAQGVIAERLPSPDFARDERTAGEPPHRPPAKPAETIEYGDEPPMDELQYGDAADAGLDRDPFGPGPEPDGDRYRF